MMKRYGFGNDIVCKLNSCVSLFSSHCQKHVDISCSFVLLDNSIKEFRKDRLSNDIVCKLKDCV